jgi:hypothetical protein
MPLSVPQHWPNKYNMISSPPQSSLAIARLHDDLNSVIGADRNAPFAAGTAVEIDPRPLGGGFAKKSLLGALLLYPAGGAVLAAMRLNHCSFHPGRHLKAGLMPDAIARHVIASR